MLCVRKEPFLGASCKMQNQFWNLFCIKTALHLNTSLRVWTELITFCTWCYLYIFLTWNSNSVTWNWTVFKMFIIEGVALYMTSEFRASLIVAVLVLLVYPTSLRMMDMWLVLVVRFGVSSLQWFLGDEVSTFECFPLPRSVCDPVACLQSARVFHHRRGAVSHLSEMEFSSRGRLEVVKLVLYVICFYWYCKNNLM